jgi:NADH:ubiquinone oxidoreductase subunit E
MLEKYTDDYILNIIENQHYKTRTMLSSLLTVQDDIGYLPKNSINVVADFMNVSTNDVWGVAWVFFFFFFF